MAGADYRSCDVCGCKTFYDATLDYQEPTEEHYKEGRYECWLHGVGDWAVICEECAKTHKVTVVPRTPPEPAAERGGTSGNEAKPDQRLK